MTRLVVSTFALEDGDDRLHRDVLFALVPAVVVGRQRDGRVGELGFASELGLGHVGHADDRHAPACGKHGSRRAWRTAGPRCTRRFRQRCARAPTSSAARSGGAGQIGHTGSAKATCAAMPLVEEGARARALVKSMNWSTITRSPGRDLLFHRSHGRHADQVRRAELLHGADVGAVVDGARRDAVPAPVARQEEQRGVVPVRPRTMSSLGGAVGRVDRHLFGRRPAAKARRARFRR